MVQHFEKGCLRVKKIKKILRKFEQRIYYENKCIINFKNDKQGQYSWLPQLDRF